MSCRLEERAWPLYSAQWLRRWMLCADACHYGCMLSLFASNFWPLMTGYGTAFWLGCIGFSAILHAGMAWTFAHINERQDAAIAWLSERSVGNVVNLADVRKRREQGGGGG